MAAAKITSLAALDRHLRGRLLVSCQPVSGGPMDQDDLVARMAEAACAGGAAGVRIAGAARVALVRSRLALPIIGITKRELTDSPVRITPTADDVRALLAAGADVIAVDATARPRPEPVGALLAAIRQGGALAMADCSGEADALAAHALGFDLIGTTLSGYTNGITPTEPDFALISRLAGKVPRLMAEGRFNRPDQARRAITLGAWAVTVGTAVTRVEVVAGWFAQAVADGGASGGTTGTQIL